MFTPAPVNSAHSSDAVSLIGLLNGLVAQCSGSIILLRELTDDFQPQRDDIDLLLTELTRTQLLQLCADAVESGRLNARIQRPSSSKVRLTLWNSAGTDFINVDLWSVFGQLPKESRRAIPAEDLVHFGEPVHPENSGAISATRRLRADLDLCLLVLHLARKHRSLDSGPAFHRVCRAIARLRQFQSSSESACASVRELLRIAEPLADESLVPPAMATAIEGWLLKTLTPAASEHQSLRAARSPARRGFGNQFRRFVMNTVPTVAIAGSDGSGKSTLCRELIRNCAGPVRMQVAKKLYRQSLLYRLASGMTRRIVGMDREVFDESTAPLLAIRAAAAHWLRVILRLVITLFITRTPRNGVREFNILDRTPASVLISGRKTDQVRLCFGASWLESLMVPVTICLLMVPYSTLAKRRQEMSRMSHREYTRKLFLQALRQEPADLILLSNCGRPEDSAAVLQKIIISEADHTSRFCPQEQSE